MHDNLARSTMHSGLSLALLQRVGPARRIKNKVYDVSVIFLDPCIRKCLRLTHK